MFAKISALCIALAGSVSGLMIVPGAETSSSGSLSGGSLSGGAGVSSGSSSGAGLTGAASGAAAVSQLQALIAQVQGGGSAGGAGGAGGAAAAPPASTAAGSKGEAGLRSKFEKAQVLHMRAANPMETADELAVESALRQAISSTPSRNGRTSIAGSSRASLA